jgi:amino acid transporter
MLAKLKSLIIGPPLPTLMWGEKRLSNFQALAAFSPDALSSIAYANQEIYLGLVIAGSAGLSMSWPIGLAITSLLVIVALSYYQTIQGYPTGGGSYIVARQNLGLYPGVIAAAALMIDYLLTAAVSLTAGVEAIASAFPILWNYRIAVSLFLLLLITLLNLRGLRETGSFMTLPVYLFVVTFLGMLVYGAVRFLPQGPHPLSAVAPPAAQPLMLVLILHAFASGCTALTGIEAISNGVPAFRPPESRNAGKTLIVMAMLMGSLFLGSIGLTQYLAVVAGPEETILSALAHRVVGSGIMYFIVQFSTLFILAVAANTSFVDFPRVAAILAKDGFLPRQLNNIGDRLVYSNGITLLSLGTAALIILFRADTHALVPLFAIGAFLAFTMSQFGMVLHWWRERGKRWSTKAFLNLIGGLVTLTTLLIVGYSKFFSGAWITLILIGVFITIFLTIHRHYEQVARQLSLKGPPPSLKPLPPPRVVVPISGVHRGMIDAIKFACSISNDVTAVYIETQPKMGEHLRQEWIKWWPDVKLEILPSPYRSIIGTLIQYLDETDQKHHDGQLAVLVLPEFVPAQFWQILLHNQSAWAIKAALLYRRRNLGYQRVIIDVPYHLRK